MPHTFKTAMESELSKVDTELRIGPFVYIVMVTGDYPICSTFYSKADADKEVQYWEKHVGEEGKSRILSFTSTLYYRKGDLVYTFNEPKKDGNTSTTLP